MNILTFFFKYILEILLPAQFMLYTIGIQGYYETKQLSVFSKFGVKEIKLKNNLFTIKFSYSPREMTLEIIR